MTVLDYAEGRTDALIAEIETLRQSDFPYQHSEHALDSLLIWYKSQREQLKRLRRRPSPDSIEARAKILLGRLADDLPLLGFILRSTNVRNAFEVYGPLLELARRHLGPQAKLILSSEWTYSPHTYAYSKIALLPEFVLIGFPASESSNPLLLPLAGHELGHSIWKNKDVEKRLVAKLKSGVIKAIRANSVEFHNHFKDIDLATLDSDVVNLPKWSPAVLQATKQAEETFCDFVGLRVFGEAYPNAFAYFVSPGYSGERSGRYPNLVRRAANIRTAATAYNLEIESDYEKQFRDLGAPRTTADRIFLLSLADQAVAGSVDTLIAEAKDQVVDTTGASPKTNIRSGIDLLLSFIPIEGSKTLADIINAGWSAYKRISDAPDNPESKISRTEQLRALREVILKSIQVFEYETMMNEPGK